METVKITKPERRSRCDRVDYRKLNSVGNDDYDDIDENSLETKKKTLPLKLKSIKQETCQTEESFVSRDEMRRSQVLSGVHLAAENSRNRDKLCHRSQHKKERVTGHSRFRQESQQDQEEAWREQLEIQRLRRGLAEKQKAVRLAETHRLRMETYRLEQELIKQQELEELETIERDITQIQEERRMKAIAEKHGTSELAHIASHPTYRSILKTVLKSQIKQLVEQLSNFAGEEAILLSASISDGNLSHIGSHSGECFLSTHAQVKSQFLRYCLKKHKKSTAQENPSAHTSKQTRTEKAGEKSSVNTHKRTRAETTTENLLINPAKHTRMDVTAESVLVDASQQTKVEQSTEHLPVNCNRQTIIGKTLENAPNSHHAGTEKIDNGVIDDVADATSSKTPVSMQCKTQQRRSELEVPQNSQDDQFYKKSSEENLSISVYGSESSDSFGTDSEDDFEDDFDDEDDENFEDDDYDDGDFEDDDEEEEKFEEEEEDDDESESENNENSVKEFNTNQNSSTEENLARHSDNANKSYTTGKAKAKHDHDRFRTIKPKIGTRVSNSDKHNHDCFSAIKPKIKARASNSDNLEDLEAMDMTCEDIIGDIDLTDGDNKILVEDVGEAVVMVKEEPESDVSVDTETERLGPPNIASGDLDPGTLLDPVICKRENVDLKTNASNDSAIRKPDHSPVAKKRTLKNKTLAQKYWAIMEVERGRRKFQVAKDMGIPSNTLSTWLRCSAKIKDDYAIHGCGPILKQRPSKHPDIDNRLLDIVKNSIFRNDSVPSHLLIEKANQIARDLGYTEKEFKCNINWLQRFKRRNSLGLQKWTDGGKDQ